MYIYIYIFDIFKNLYNQLYEQHFIKFINFLMMEIFISTNIEKKKT